MLTRIDAMRERAVAESCTFTRLIPTEPRKGGADWTLKTATPLLERLATGDYVPNEAHRRCTCPMDRFKAIIGSPPVFGAVGV
jgi:hypothetical protein